MNRTARDPTVIHIRDDLIRQSSKVGWGVFDGNPLALLQPTHSPLTHSLPMNLQWRWTASSPFPSPPQGGRGCRRRERRRFGGSKRESLRVVLSPTKGES